MPEREDVDIADFYSTGTDDIEDVIEIISELKDNIGTIDKTVDIEEVQKVLDAITEIISNKTPQIVDKDGIRTEVQTQASVDDIQTPRSHEVDLTDQRRELDNVISGVPSHSVINLLDNRLRQQDIDLDLDTLPESEKVYDIQIQSLIDERDKKFESSDPQKIEELRVPGKFDQPLFRGTSSRELIRSKVGQSVKFVTTLLKHTSVDQELLGTSMTTDPNISLAFTRDVVVRIDKDSIKDVVSLMSDKVRIERFPELVYKVIIPDKIKNVINERGREFIEKVVSDLRTGITDDRGDKYPQRSLDEFEEYRKNAFTGEVGEYYTGEFEEYDELLKEQREEGTDTAHTEGMFQGFKKTFLMDTIDTIGILPSILMGDAAQKIIDQQQEITTVNPTEISLDDMTVFAIGEESMARIRENFGDDVELFDLRKLTEETGEDMSDILQKPRDELRTLQPQERSKDDKSMLVIKILQHVLSRIDISIKYNVLQIDNKSNSGMSNTIQEISKEIVNTWIDKLEAII